jgi:SAM-dependent methyltransferase
LVARAALAIVPPQYSSGGSGVGQYPDEFIDRLHLVWGMGFLSPGGREEVAAIVKGLDLAGVQLLDIGCGTGGPAQVLARDHGAKVTGIDVEPQLIERARRLAGEARLGEGVMFRLVEPGPLPFSDAGFDAVFSKDALLHIPDKQALYREVLRVLKPGGVFAASDWLAGEDAADDAALRLYIEMIGLEFTMATAEETAAAMRDAGFEGVSTFDRQPWYATVSAQEVAAIEGPLRAEIIAVSSAAIYERWLGARRALAEAVGRGALRPTHLRGYRPL